MDARHYSRRRGQHGPPCLPRKLIIQIPCLNEAEALPITLKDLPRHMPGYDVVEWLIIDDGSTDDTGEVAKAHGVDHIVSLGGRYGLAVAFMVGIETCLRLGADTIVNMDADNQYCAENIPDLVRPILDGRAQIVIGARPILETESFSWFKRRLQRLGSWVVRVASKTDIPDAPSGFRAIHYEAAMQLNVFTAYTYTLEMIVQAGRKRIPITWVPIKTNPPLRPSRLISSVPRYIALSVLTILRIFITYKPARFFGILEPERLGAWIDIDRPLSGLVLAGTGRRTRPVPGPRGQSRGDLCSPPDRRIDCRSHRHQQTAAGGHPREDAATGGAFNDSQRIAARVRPARRSSFHQLKVQFP